MSFVVACFLDILSPLGVKMRLMHSQFILPPLKRISRWNGDDASFAWFWDYRSTSLTNKRNQIHHEHKLTLTQRMINVVPIPLAHMFRRQSSKTYCSFHVYFVKISRYTTLKKAKVNHMRELKDHVCHLEKKVDHEADQLVLETTRERTGSSWSWSC